MSNGFPKFFSKFWNLKCRGEKKSFYGGSLLQSIYPPKKRLLCISQFSEKKDYYGEKCYTSPIQTKIKMTTMTNIAIIKNSTRHCFGLWRHFCPARGKIRIFALLYGQVVVFHIFVLKLTHCRNAKFLWEHLFRVQLILFLITPQSSSIGCSHLTREK